jgi:L-lactate dehydrogenase complex protein LldE
MHISLFVPCYQDAFYPSAALSVARVLERLGHSIQTHPNLTCCGQPSFNSGYWNEARPVAHRVLQELQDSEAVVVPSGSCGAMLRVFYPQLFAGTPDEDAANALAPRVFEFSQFLVDELGVTDVGACFPHRVTFHDGCHGLREMGVVTQPRELLKHVSGLELIEMNEAQTCCGFGGAFSVKFGDIATAMGEVKTDSARATQAEFLVSNDSSCMMHIQGLLDRQKRNGQAPMKCIHLAEVLAQTDGAS